MSSTTEKIDHNILTESVLGLADAANELPPSGRDREKPINFSTVYRWVLKGIVGPGRKRIRLEAVRVGGRWITSREAIQRFVERLTPSHDDDEDPDTVTPTALAILDKSY